MTVAASLQLRERAATAAASIRSTLPWLAILAIAFVFYSAGVDRNPPGFYLDEASLAYNAYALSIDGRDEHGVAWPLYLQTWDPSVAANPVYVYALAGVFKVFGPSIFAARMLSALLGFTAAVLLGGIAGRMTNNHRVAWIVAACALLTPWLFQVSRLVFEVAMLPLVLVLFLLLVSRVARKPTWSALEVVLLGVLLGLLTYTYTVGRLLGPMLAFGLILFASRSRSRYIVATWLVFGLTLLPAIIFNISTDGALTARANVLSYINPGMSVIDIGASFLNHLLANLDPRRMLLLGDPNIRHHVPVMGSILLGTLALAIVGLDRVAHGRWREAWTRYVLYGLLVSLVPASLTIDDFHTLRLVAFPVFMLLLVGAGADWLDRGGVTRRIILAFLVVLTLTQAVAFQVQFWRYGPDRGYAFDAAFPDVFEAALAADGSPIYLRDRGDIPGYIEAYWYGALRGMDRSSFVRLRSDEVPPPGAVVLGTDKSCGSCEVLRENGDYIAYRAGGLGATGLIPNAHFEEIGTTQLGEFGAPIYGWSSSSDSALAADGARTEGAHLVLGHVTETTTTKQATSAIVAVGEESSLGLEAFVRAGRGGPVTATIALIELDAGRQFVTWRTTSADLPTGGDWQQVRIEPGQLDSNTEFVQVACYLEPGGSPGDSAEFDDITVSPVL